MPRQLTATCASSDADFVATINHDLGIAPHDPQNRPFVLTQGNPFPL